MAIETSPTISSADPFFQGRRFPGRTRFGGGTPIAAGDVALSAGFGTTASVAVTAGSTDTRGEITVTSAGTGQAANPTATLTFKDGAYAAAPTPYVRRNGGSQATVAISVSATTTALTLTFRGTPVAAETYVIGWACDPA